MRIVDSAVWCGVVAFRSVMDKAVKRTPCSEDDLLAAVRLHVASGDGEDGAATDRACMAVLELVQHMVLRAVRGSVVASVALSDTSPLIGQLLELATPAVRR